MIVVLLVLILLAVSRTVRWLVVLFVTGVILTLVSAHADPYDDVAPLRDRIVHDFRQATMADLAALCRIRSFDWAAERAEIFGRDALQATKDNGLAYSIYVESNQAYTTWRSLAFDVGVATSDCIDLKRSGEVERLDATPGASITR